MVKSIIFLALSEYPITAKALKLSKLNLSLAKVLAAEMQQVNRLGVKSFLNIDLDVSIQITRSSGILFSDIVCF